MGVKMTNDKPEQSNRLCGCGRKIKKDDNYYMRIEPGEMPEIFCEFCISINM
jgi:hypothetical protein